MAYAVYGLYKDGKLVHEQNTIMELKNIESIYLDWDFEIKEIVKIGDKVIDERLLSEEEIEMITEKEFRRCWGYSLM